MNLKEVKDLIQEILRSDIMEFELEQTGTKVRLRRGESRAAQLAVSHPHIEVPPALLDSPALTAERLSPLPPPADTPAEDGLHLIVSPIVGTFYTAPSPDTRPYVKIGDTVEEGATLCIVEAMKLMNEIPSDVAGTIEAIYVENGHPVEYAQKLFAIRPHR